MDIFEITDSDSETCDYSEDEVENTDDILNFCDRITEELQLCFRKNSGSEDYCKDVYEENFETAQSGSYSYYADILAIAQLNEKADDGLSLKRSSGVVHKNNTESRIIYPSNWKCSGQWDPTVGAGPLEELFQVLEHTPRPQNIDDNPLVYAHWSLNNYLPNTYDEELIGIDPMDGEYSSFIDIFHRWNNDSFTSLPSTSNTEFVPNDY